jgi:DNA-directed RNA polymerase subunit omega
MARISIEDCQYYIENRFALVSVAANRTRQLMEGADALIKSKNKMAVTALREIADGLIDSHHSEGHIDPEALRNAEPKLRPAPLPGGDD